MTKMQPALTRRSRSTITKGSNRVEPSPPPGHLMTGTIQRPNVVFKNIKLWTVFKIIMFMEILRWLFKLNTFTQITLISYITLWQNWGITQRESMLQFQAILKALEFMYVAGHFPPTISSKPTEFRKLVLLSSWDETTQPNQTDPLEIPND
jgi:hypothetical protein